MKLVERSKSEINLIKNDQNITVIALSRELLEDYLKFFDNYAFIDNPHWSSCYCYFPHAPHEICTWKERTAEENRHAVSNLIMNNKMHGYITYHNGKPIGWCNAGPRINMTITPDYEELETDKIGSIVCFIIAKAYRRKGISRLMLDAACNGFKAHGFKYAEGYPIKNVEGEAANHHGPLELYLSAGFTQYATEDDTIIMRKLLNK